MWLFSSVENTISKAGCVATSIYLCMCIIGLSYSYILVITTMYPVIGHMQFASNPKCFGYVNGTPTPKIYT